MSSVKRRKVDEDVPSGLLKSKKEKASRPASISASSSPEPESTPAVEPTAQEAELTKTFSDLVGKSLLYEKPI
jgi:ATP-dependent RNA helicase DDX47/RRP3